MRYAIAGYVAGCVLVLQATLAAEPLPADASVLSEEFLPLQSPVEDVLPPYAWSPLRSPLMRREPVESDPWGYHFLPEGLIYRSYLAGVKEPRMGCQWVYERDQGGLWDFTVGARVGLMRYGTSDGVWPEGFQIDLEGAAFPRLTLDSQRDLVSVDFRGGVPLTYRTGPWEYKLAYYHLSSHLGDEYMLKNPAIRRINYSRDAIVLGTAVRPGEAIRIYGEAGWAFWADEGADPWEFQFGIEYSPTRPTDCCGAPFFAINGHLREEVDFGGSLTVQTGWQWRSQMGRLVRTGLHYLNGKSENYEFVQEHEEQIGLGLWYDF